MVNDVFVLNEGQSVPTSFTSNPSAGTFNRNTSVNPNIVTMNGSSTTALGIHCYEIHSDTASAMGSGTVSSSKVNRLFPLNTTVPSYADNKFDSTNYRVIIDTGSANGIKEGSHLLGSSSCTRDYFIVIYADNPLKHHVAKITEESIYEGNFYKFDFTPSLKENISAGTKVAIYQGPLKTDNVVAVGYGLLNDVLTTEERHDKYVNVSRPTFYFYEGEALEANTKFTLLKTSTNSAGPQVSVFKTAPQTSDYLLDKSFFTHNALIVDVNKSNDDDVSQPKGINSYTAVGSNYTFARGTYAQSSLNIYDSDGGHNTYLQFVDSPERTQLLSTPYHLNTSKTVTTRGNMFEAKYYDTERILEHKIRDYEDIKIKEIIHTQNVSTIPESELPGIFSRKSSTTIEVTGLVDGQDLRTLLYDSSTGVWEPFFVDNYYYECQNAQSTKITAPVDGVQTITISDSRAVTSNFWSGSASVHNFVSQTAFRKFYSRVTGTILTTHKIDTEYDGTTITRNGITLTETESDIYNLEYSIQGTNYGRHLKVAKGDKNNGYVTLVAEPTSSYFGVYTSPLSGNLLVSKTTFEGKVESKETSVESTGTFKLSISGRDEIATLLNTPVNRNYTYSKEYVYSTFSPYNTNYTSISRTIDSISGAVINVNSDITGTLLEFGDVIYVRDSAGTYYYLLGVVKSVNGQDITLVKDSYITELGEYTGNTTLSTVIYKANKALLAGKTLETSLRTAERATTLIGTADKGAVFTTGKYFNNDGSKYLDTERLSALGSGGNTNGVDIDNLINTVNDSTTYFDSPVGFDFDHHTISSMVEFEILNNIDLKNGNTQYEVGYISPIVLGRVEVDNLEDDFIDIPLLNTNRKTQNIHLINGQGMPLGGYLHMLDGKLNADKSPKTFNLVFQDDPGYSGGEAQSGQYATRFNTPIWRYSNKSQSKLYRRKFSDFSLGGGMFAFAANDYYEKTSNFNFYLSSYKASMSTIPIADFHADETNSAKPYRKDLPTERTGIDPVVGAKSYLMTRYPDEFHTSKYNLGRRIGVSQSKIGHSEGEGYDLVFDLYDNYTGPLHIFSVGDVYPESKKNPNNIGFTEGTYSRNLADYAVVFKGKARGSNKSFKHTNWGGKTIIKNRLDDDYFYQPIQTTEGNLRRMNLIRLTEVTYDSLFNEVDYENFELNNSGTKETLNIHRNRQTSNSFIVKSFPESGWSPIHITLADDISAGSTIEVNDVRFFSGVTTGNAVSNSGTDFYLFTDPYNSFSEDIKPAHIQNAAPFFIGKINRVNTSTKVITFVDAIQSKLYSGTGYDTGDRLYVIAVPSGTSLLHRDYLIQGGKDNQLAHTSTSETASGVATLNYNRTLALTNYGNGSTADDDGNGDAIAQANRKPLDTINANVHDLNAILLPNYFYEGDAGNGVKLFTSYGTQANAEKQNFRWVCDGQFNGATLTLSASNMTDFFTSNGFGTDYFNSFATTFDGSNISSAVITITQAGSGYDGTYKISNVTDTALTLQTDSSGTAANFNISSKTGIIITLHLHSSTRSDSIEHIIPHRLLQESNRLGDIYSGYNFTYGDTDLVISSIWQGNVRSVPFNIVKSISGSLYPYEPMKIEYYTGNIKGKKYDNQQHTMVYGKYLVYGNTEDLTDDDTNNPTANGEATGILEINLDTGGDNFAGVTPVDILFRPYIDTASGVTLLDNSDDDSLNNTTGSKEKIIRITIQENGLKRSVTPTPNHWVHFSNNLTGYYLYQEGNKRLHKIVSHTVSKDTSQFYHYIRIDNADSVSNKLYLMRINQTCFYDFSPKKIDLNEASSEYTKMAGYDEMLSTPADSQRFMNENIINGGPTVAGVRSMYCMIEPDGGGGNYLIPREDDEYSFTNSFPTGESYRILMTDGITKLDTEMFVSSNKKLEFSDIKEMKGSPSVGSIFSISVNTNPSFEPDSLSICSPFNISLDSEDIADDILTSAGISYTKDTSTDNYYIGSNFTGENSYAAINNVLSFKKKKLTIDGDTIKIISNEEEKEYRSIEFNEEENIHKVTSIKKDKSLYDNFNEIVVFGDGVKGTAKNYRDIKKRGSRVKEVYDFSLITDNQVSEKAQQLLKLFTSLQSAIEIQVGDNIPLLQPGNIVSVYYPSEGILRGDYMVIEIEKNIGMPTKLLLGEYNRDLANTFTMLISETRNLQGKTKQKVYTSVTSPNIDIQSLRVKFVKATITNTSSLPTELGFTYTLGFNARMGL